VGDALKGRDQAEGQRVLLERHEPHEEGRRELRAAAERDAAWVRARREAGRSEREKLRSSLRSAVETHRRVMRGLRSRMRELLSNYP